MTEVPQEDREAAVRILGAADAYAHMLVNIRARIARVMAAPIDERHTRKLAARDQVLRPLVSLRDMCELRHRECQNAYRKRMAGKHQ